MFFATGFKFLICYHVSTPGTRFLYVLHLSTMRLQLPQYSGKDTRVMAGIVPLFSFIINFIIFGKEYILDLRIFVTATIIAAIGFTIDFILCGWVAVSMKQRFPREEQILK